MKVAAISFAFNHPTGKRNLGVMQEIAKSHEVHIITVSNWDGFNDSSLSKMKNLNFHFLEPWFVSKKSLQYRYVMKGLEKEIEKINPDLIYIENEPLAFNTFKASKIAKKKNIPIICFTWENLFIDKGAIVNWYEKSTLSRITHFVAGSVDAKKVLEKKGVQSAKIDVLPQTGIDTNKFRNLRTSKEIDCLFVGRLEKEKGIEMILKAKQVLDERGETYRFHFVGDGSLFDMLAKEEVSLQKWIDHDKLAEIYNRAKIFLYPSIPTSLWEEQFGFSMVEALSCGLPVVASNTTGPREIVKSNDGVLIEPGNVKELADAISKTLKNRIPLSRHAQENAKRFDNKEIAKKLEKVFEKVK